MSSREQAPDPSPQIDTSLSLDSADRPAPDEPAPDEPTPHGLAPGALASRETAQQDPPSAELAPSVPRPDRTAPGPGPTAVEPSAPPVPTELAQESSPDVRPIEATAIETPLIETPLIETPPFEKPVAPPRPRTVHPGVDYGLDPGSVTADRLRRFITAGILSAIALPFAIGIAVSWPPGRWLLPLLWAVFAALLAARAWWWPAVRYRYISYRLDEKALTIRRGVWWRSVTLVPRSRVQHTDVSQGPIERNYGLGTLIVHTAGTQFAAVPLSGLAHGTATEIRDVLIEEPVADDAV